MKTAAQAPIVMVLSSDPSPTPTYDPLLTPVLPDNPSPAEMGQFLYFFHCMPCHGDLGQGLTDEFRGIWVEDHQNCWAKGCHTGRPNDEGFPIPTYVPKIISEQDALIRFRNFESLKTYLFETHPPQYPGKLTDDEYQDITSYLWISNNKPTPNALIEQTPTPSQTFTPAPTHTPAPTNTPQNTVAPLVATMTSPSLVPAEALPMKSGMDATWMLIAAISIVLFLILFLLAKRKR